MNCISESLNWTDSKVYSFEQSLHTSATEKAVIGSSGRWRIKAFSAAVGYHISHGDLFSSGKGHGYHNTLMKMTENYIYGA